ncbi:hypothetical protein AsAng_0022650 [Aureispira anguillae]|uniref:Uncharacterized protein n=1 Tax=Aureispira anguillae TaxID=2864201 RepID=A0A915YEJ7_9BACT|nr:hypothetical protein AsAng_0022650 [Aureispira anguillae]
MILVLRGVYCINAPLIFKRSNAITEEQLKHRKSKKSWMPIYLFPIMN